LGLVLPSKTPGSGARVATSQIAALAKKEILRLVEAVERMQRADREFRILGVD
jgi:hypothetical protein